MSQIVFRNFSLLDPRWDEPRGGYEVLVEGETIKEVSNKPIKARNARVVDGDPVKQLELFLDQGAHLPVIMKAGKFHKHALR